MMLLWLAYFLNQADRQIFSIVLPFVKQDLNLTDAQIGLIAASLVCAYGLMVPVAGFAGDRYSKKRIIVLSLMFWSMATLVTGFCSTVIQFVLVRGILTGGGEAFYAPAANTYISEKFSERRTLALSIHQSAVYFGIILSGVIAGAIAERYGWRSAFWGFGICGILTAALMFLILKNTDSVITQSIPRLKDTMVAIGKSATFYLLTFAFGCMVFVNIAYLTWMPTLLIERFGLKLTDAGFSSMFYHHMGAFLGILAGGIITDRLAKRKPVIRLVLQALALLAGAPFIYWIGKSATPGETYLSLFLFGCFRGIYDANIFASLYEIVKPSLRASASGIMLMAAFIVGALGPYILGILKQHYELSLSFSYLWIPYVMGGLSILAASLFFFKTDRYEMVQDN